MTIRVLIAHSRDGVGGSVITGALLAREGCTSGRWSPTCVCNSRGPVFDLHERFGVDVIALSDFVKLSYTPDPTDGNRVRRVLKRLFLIRAARRYLATERPDIIHVHDKSSALAWGLAAKQAEIPLVWHVHQQASQPAVDWILRRLATHVVFVADTNRCRFRTLNGVSHSVIHNGVDLGTFRPRDQPSHNAPSIGFISNLVDRKRPDWVIRAAGHLVRHGLDVRVVIAGNDFTMGIKTQTLRTLAERGAFRTMRVPRIPVRCF